MPFAVSGVEAPAVEDLGPIPWQCWDIPQFKECHTEAGHRAHRKLVFEDGLSEDSQIYKDFYPQFLRLYVHDCQVSHACTPEAIQLAQEIANQAPSMPSEGWSWKMYALAGVGALALLYLYQRNQKS